jgi:hypothetical protein
MSDDKIVFISYASEDKIFARKLFDRLEKDDFKPWLDEENLSVGERWEDAIVQSIQKSRFVIACFSSASVAKTGYIQKELRLALSEIEKKPYGHIYFIPILLDKDVDLPHLRVGTVQLRDYHAIKVINDNDMEHLVICLNKYINPDQEIVIEFNHIDTNSSWFSGIIKGNLLFSFDAKCFEMAGDGIGGGKISKLIIWDEKADSRQRVLVSYDRGWDVMPYEIDRDVIPYYKELLKTLDGY